MKTKIILFIGAVALITLSFTFSTKPTRTTEAQKTSISTHHEPTVIGFIADEVVK